MAFYGLEKMSLIEWPGKICAVLFVGGCNFRCPFCYNRDLVLNCDKLSVIPDEMILKFLELRKRWLDGVIISGGEPLRLMSEKFQNNLIDFIKKVRKLGLGIGIETNGSNPELLEKLIKEKLVDFVAMDIKSPLGSMSNIKTQISKYDELTRVKIDLEKIKTSINLIKNSEIDYEFRTTVAPLLSEEDLLEIAEELKGAKRYALQVFRPVETLIDSRLAKMKFFSREKLDKIGQKIKNYFEKFEIRG